MEGVQDSQIEDSAQLTFDESFEEKLEKRVNLHHSELVCVKPPHVEPDKEIPRGKQCKRPPKLIKGDKDHPPVMMAPSEYLAQLKQTTEQRLANTCTMHLPRKMRRLEVNSTLDNKTFQVSEKEPLFQAFPSEIYFQNFVPRKTYHLALLFRNKDVVSRHIRVTQMDSPYFRVVSPASHGSKVSPGISVTFDVYFLPDVYKDYEHELTFITDREMFVVPIHATGARGFLDFPDHIHFETSPVKYHVSKTLLIRNLGNRVANFSISMEKSDKASFSVKPDVGCLEIDEVTQVTIQFYPLQTGNHRDKMVITYDTGEQIQVQLYGSAQDVNIQLKQKSIVMNNTFISTLTQYSVTIHNYSDIRSFFRWTQFATQEEEDQQKLLFSMKIRCSEHQEVSSYLDKQPILSRNLHNKVQAVNNKSMLFEDEVICFDPLEGEVWPKTSVDVNIIFKPYQAAKYSRVAFCDVIGRQSRLPLRIIGEGIGPKLDFSFEELDMGNIFVGLKNQYELVVWNKGAINATYSILPNFNDFGPCFEFEPCDGHIAAGDYQAIRVAFLSTQLGNICECFRFQIEGTSNNKLVIFKGAVIAPSFTFSVSKLDFGTVSYGFQCKRSFSILNTSLVPITFQLRVPSDGSLPSIHAMGKLPTNQSGLDPSPIPLRGLSLAKEFDIHPWSGRIEAQSSQEVTVALTSNHVQIYEQMMVVDIVNVGRELQGLPLFARCILPCITLLTPELDYGRCCLRYPFSRHALLQNNTDWPASYIVPPQAIPLDKSELPTILYSSSQPRGMVAPHSVQEVPIELQVQKVNEQSIICDIAIFGSDGPTMQVKLRCCGEGPVVHLDPDRLDWGSIPVLTRMSKTLELSNQSPIPTIYTASFTSQRVPFTVSPENGEIPPESFSTLTVTAYLDDCINFQCMLLISLVESNTRRVHVEATGEGNLVVSDPPLLPHIDLGPIFCNAYVVRKFKLTNKCRRHHQLIWSTEGFCWSQSRRRIVQDHKNKKKAKAQAVDMVKPVFMVSPSRFSLKPGQSIDFTVEACVSEARAASEVLLCHAILGKTGNKDVIMKVQFSANFVRPVLEFSTKDILFHVEKMPQDRLCVMEKHLQFMNVSSLPLTITMELQYPFSICSPNGSTTTDCLVYLPDQEKHDLIVCFDPDYKRDLHSRFIEGTLYFTYKEHSHVDKVHLKGEVLFPNLEFDKTVVNFGCILNDTEVIQHVWIKNISPLQVKYRWSYLVNPKYSQVRRIIRPRAPGALKMAELKEMEARNKEEHNLLKVPNEDRDDSASVYTSSSDIFIDCFKEIVLLTTAQVMSRLPMEEKFWTSGSSTENTGGVTTEENRERTAGCVVASNNLVLNQEEQEALNSNPVLLQLMDKHCTTAPLSSVEEVFDILPLFGTLNPGEREHVIFSFFGHANIFGEVRALCEVEGGPNYEVTLTGEAGLVEYHFEVKELDFGKQLYDMVGVKELTLVNTGHVPFRFYGLDVISVSMDHPVPGELRMVPFSGTMDPLSEQKLQVRYLPGVPGPFTRQFFVQVAHYEPDLISICGEGVFPCISLDLPRYLTDSTKAQAYQTLLTEACHNLMPNKSHTSITEFTTAYIAQACSKQTNSGDGGRHPGSAISSGMTSQYQDPVQQEATETLPTRRTIEQEVERLAVRNFVICTMERETRNKAQDTSTSQELISSTTKVSDKVSQTMPSSSTAKPKDMHASDSKTGSSKKRKPRLPPYLLDFGYVVPGTQCSHTVKATNTSWCPVSFRMKQHTGAEPGALCTKGFVVGIDKVYHLPGTPENETVDFVVSFDPKVAGLPVGPVKVKVTIDILHGPMVKLVLCANVTVPGLTLSTDHVEMGSVKCGECRISVVQLHNHQQVPCEWTAVSANSVTGADRTEDSCASVLQRRRRSKFWSKGLVAFEVLPASGTLQPDQRTNVQVIFTPTEEKNYEETLRFQIAQSEEQLTVMCMGQGLEPHLEFSEFLLEFSPILPYSEGDWQTVTISNPCTFPVEMYCIDMDTQYIEEEKVLRKIRGYDSHNILLLPPRNAGDKLPSELFDYCEECRMREEEEMIQEGVHNIQSGPSLEVAENEGNSKVDSSIADLRKPVSGDDQKKVGEGDPSVTETVIVSQPHVAAIVPSKGDQQELPTLDTDTAQDVPISEPVQVVLRKGAGKSSQVHSNPVWQSLAGYLGIDLTQLGKPPVHNSGIAIIVHGAPSSGKSITAHNLGQYYNAAVLSLDGVVIEAISTPISSAAFTARELCEEAARLRIEEAKLQESQNTEGSLTRNVDTPSSAAESKAAPTGKNKCVTNCKSISLSQAGAEGRQIPSQVGECRPVCQKLSINSIGGDRGGIEEGLASCVLPEIILTTLLLERLQMEDCSSGVVFDGLETLFAANLFCAANIILKALNNRRFIFFCSLKLDYFAHQEIERDIEKNKEAQIKQKEELQRQEIEEMEEDEYDTLSQEEKDRLDLARLNLKKQRMKREQVEKERRERVREEEERRKEEEHKNIKRKNKPQKRKSEVRTGSSGIDLTSTVANNKNPDTEVKKGKKLVKNVKNEDMMPAILESSVVIEEATKDPVKNSEILLSKRFKVYDYWHKDLSALLDLWDRTTLQLRRPPQYLEVAEEEPVKKAKGKGERGEKDRPKQDKESNKQGYMLEEISEIGLEMDGGEEEDTGRVPHIIIDCADRSVPPWQKILDLGLLPTKEEVLDGMGMGPQGPHIPPPTTLAVVHYPVKRKPHTYTHPTHFVFVECLPEEVPLVPTVNQDNPEPEADEEKTENTSVSKSKASAKSKGSTESTQKSGKEPKSKKSVMREDIPPIETINPSLSPRVPTQEKLTSFRWVIPAHGQLKLRLFFTSEEVGQFEQTFRFEIVGVMKQYQLVCKGVCGFPTISKEPKIVFLSRKKTLKENEIVNRKYILSTQTYEFGPLLVGKNREHVSGERGQDSSTELFYMHNPSQQIADVNFSFMNDSKSLIFSIDSISLSIPPGETQPLTVCATPMTAGRHVDGLVCCIRENPEPVVFTIACDGVKPEVILDKKQLHFDRVLVHRKDTKVITLHNPTMLPVAWCLVGLEVLGDDFMVDAHQGVLQPMSQYPIQAYFRALKCVQHNKRMIRLEVSDVEESLGVVQSEPIQVSAEAYDVSLDIIFSKGHCATVDFGAVRVNEEVSQPITLRNKGRYEIGCYFEVDKTDPALASVFTFTPAKLILSALDRPIQVMAMCKCPWELELNDVTLFKCVLVEIPTKGEKMEEKKREVIASIPIKVIVKAVYSKYNIVPSVDINFGSLVVNNRKTRTLTIHNNGDFEFKCTIRRKADSTQPLTGCLNATKKLDQKMGGRLNTGSNSYKKDSRIECPGARLLVGCFIIYPSISIIKPGNSCNFVIDCIPDKEGVFVEELTISISESNPKHNPAEGVPYKLLAEGCVSSINIDDVASIFEEHHIWKSLLHLPTEIEGCGVYGEEEKRFVFSHVIVGRKARARFKITNTSKVPCDVVFLLRPGPQKGVHKISNPPQNEVFELEPQRANILGHSSMFVTVYFTPTAMQMYSAVFEAFIEGILRSRPLVFEISGEGTLPRVTIMSPTVRGRSDQLLMVFNKLLVGRSQVLPLTLLNTGLLPCKVDLDLTDPEGVFTMLSSSNTAQFSEDSLSSMFKLHTVSIVLAVGETITFDMRYTPSTDQRSTASVKMCVVDNPYEDYLVTLVGEGHREWVTVDNILGCRNMPLAPVFYSEDENIRSLADAQCPSDLSPDQSIMEPVAECYLLSFGDCAVNVPHNVTFTLTNNSPTECVRFTWPTSHPNITFSPQVGHLHANSTKEIVVTFLSTKPLTIIREVMNGQVVTLQFNSPLSQVPQWDDSVKVIKWVDMDGASEDKNNRPLKRKISEVVKEPSHRILMESMREVELVVAALVDFSRCVVSTNTLHFASTMVFQKRIAQFTMQNSGAVTLKYEWSITMEQAPFPANHSLTTLVLGEGRMKGQRKSADAGGNSPNPFTVYPQEGTIEPGCATVFNVKFSPLDIGHYMASVSCSIPNLDPGIARPTVLVQGDSILPRCHFDVSLSDYLTSLRRNPTLSGPGGAVPGTPVDPSMRVVECHTVGINTICLREFSIVNPTNTRYKFQWVCLDGVDQHSAPNSQQPFECIYLKGHTDGGCSSKMLFKYMSSKIGIVESFWFFTLPDQGISIPFLLYGHTREAQVFFDKPHVTFRPLMLGHKETQTVHVVNKESQALNFQFVDNSCHTEGFASRINLNPMAGKVLANSRAAIQLTFVPTLEKEVVFNVLLKVQHIVSPLTLNIKAEGYAMNYNLYTKTLNGKKVQLSAQGINTINFGNVEVKEEVHRQLYINNTSIKYSLDFCWKLTVDKVPVSLCSTTTLPFKCKPPSLRIEPDSGCVASGETDKCTLIFCPSKCAPLRGYELTLKTNKGPGFSIAVTGQGVLPGLQLSFHSHNFGYTFVQKCMEPFPSTTLILTNTYTKDISVSCQYTPTPQLQHNFEGCVLGVGKSTSITFTFTPPEDTVYKEVVVFKVNGTSQHSVEFTGTGCDVKVEVEEKCFKRVSLGALYVGDVVKKAVPVVNRSLAPFTLNIFVSTFSRTLQSVGLLSVCPSGPITLPPNGGQLLVDVIFQPKGRIPEFCEQVTVQSGPLSLPLFTLTGSCLAMEVALDTNHLPFGTVYLRSCTSRKLTLTNRGDINTRYRWDVNNFKPDFSIFPVEGYVTPGMEVTFEVKFHPQRTSGDIRYEELRCFVDGGPQTVATLTLTLTGSCTDITPMKETLNFLTQVRGKDSRSIAIINPTLQLWTLTPIIEGEQWSGPDTFTVEAQQTRLYEVVYRPLTMTTDAKHTGSLFFPFPDGLGQLHLLSGTALPPKLSGRVTQDTPAKAEYKQILPVHNWLSRPMRFVVKIDIVSDKSGKSDPCLKINNVDYIDVPANSNKLYKFTVYACREGPLHLKVTFSHEPSGEYQWYEVFLRFTKPGSVGTIELTTPVRRSVKHRLTLENPLSQQAVFSAFCTVPEVLLPSSNVTVPPYSKAPVIFDFMPLKSGEITGKLELYNPDLGHTIYDLVLRATSPNLERSVYFSSIPMGQNQTQTIRFTCFTKQRVEFTCKVDNTDFQVDKTLVVNPASMPAGIGYSSVDASLDVLFEPSSIGEQRACLLISSPVGGDYEFPLVASCYAPTPQGPFSIKVGGSTTVVFRNIFTTSVRLNLQVEPSVFRVQQLKEMVRPKREQRISVYFDGNKECREDINGRLVISCVSPVDETTVIQWVYYLKGTTSRQDYHRPSSIAP